MDKKNEGRKKLCGTESEYFKVECKISMYDCVDKSFGFAKHPMNEMQTCPDETFVARQLCHTCKNPKEVEEYAVQSAFRNIGKGVSKRVEIYVLMNENELESKHWESKHNMCQLKEKRRYYECTNIKWACDMSNSQKGRAVHDLNKNGHLADWN